MRSASNFHPEWGYLAPAPSFMRTARVVIVATAVGATAGAAVVLSLVDRPATDGGRIAAHAIVTSVEAAPAASAPAAAAVALPVAPATVVTAAPAIPPAAPAVPAVPQIATVARPVVAPPPAAAAPQPAVVNAAVDGSSPETPTAAPSIQPAPGNVSLSEIPTGTQAGPQDAHEDALVPPETAPPESVPPEKKPKHHVGASYTPNPGPTGLGTLLRRLFNAPTTAHAYYPANR